MMFVVETEKKKKIERFVEASQKRAQDASLFMGERQIFARPFQKDYLRIYVILKPIASNMMLYIAAIVMIPALVFSWDPVSYAFPLGIALLKFFETEYFGYYAMRVKLYMIGYKGFIRKVPTSQLIEEAFYDAKRSL